MWTRERGAHQARRGPALVVDRADPTQHLARWREVPRWPRGARSARRRRGPAPRPARVPRAGVRRAVHHPVVNRAQRQDRGAGRHLRTHHHVAPRRPRCVDVGHERVVPHAAHRPRRRDLRDPRFERARAARAPLPCVAGTRASASSCDRSRSIRDAATPAPEPPATVAPPVDPHSDTTSAGGHARSEWSRRHWRSIRPPSTRHSRCSWWTRSGSWRNCATAGCCARTRSPCCAHSSWRGVVQPGSDGRTGRAGRRRPAPSRLSCTHTPLHRLSGSWRPSEPARSAGCRARVAVRRGSTSTTAGGWCPCRPAGP